ncbi:hypothetical protein [Streptomyces similanensis]|uniref:Integral membrane protein n=1 Tax=Streptomyces similanensis TaxID=1274988 RepID=A0ABP9KKW5_9ACTN|nr:hypothetical protein HUT11_25245 [Streptomyces seoulensis]
MSYGDPNNPYGQPQGQPGYPSQEQGYGAPQQGQPGYGYPQAPAVQQPYGAVPQTMPGTVSGARAMLWVIVGLQVVGAVIFALGAVGLNAAKNDESLKDDSSFQQLVDYSTGKLWALVVFAIAWGVFAAVLATKFNSGGNGVRVTLLVFGIITAVLGLYPFTLIGIVHLVLAILIACFVGGSKGKAWFNRPRY